MYKVIVKLKEESQHMDFTYPTDDLYKIIREEAIKCDLVIQDKFTYTIDELKYAFGKYWKFIFCLRRLNWFQHYIKEWLWCDDTIKTCENPDGSEDLIKNFLSR